jgi:adenylyltransferase/sulfurtransferase
MLVPSIGPRGQRRLEESSVLVVGAGGLGSSVLFYLAGAGIGHMEVIDFDVVDESNLHRQIIHNEARVGTLKCESAADAMKALNSNINVAYRNVRLTCENALDIVTKFDVVVDASDNFEARYTINDACVLSGVPLISGSAVGMEGQLTVLNLGGTCPCYRCLHPTPSIAEACRSCANAGVLGPVPGLIGCMQAVETIKVLVSYKVGNTDSHRKVYCRDETAPESVQPLCNRQVFYDGCSGEFMTFELSGKDPACRVCGNCPDILTMMDSGAHLHQCMEEAICATVPDSTLMTQRAAEVTVMSYYEDVIRAGKPHLLLDVRSSVQYQMVSMEYYLTPEAFPFTKCSTGTKEYTETPSQTVATMRGQMACGTVRTTNIPLRVLSANTENVATWRRSCTEDEPSALPVFVVCRRGIDSVRATELLLRQGYTDVYNVSGGLEEWKKAVDPNFPSY